MARTKRKQVSISLEDMRKSNADYSPNKRFVYTIDHYLYHIFYNAYHKNPDLVASAFLYKWDYERVKAWCESMEFVQHNKITDNGVNYLRYREISKLNSKMVWFNVLMVIATFLIAIFTFLTYLKS